MAAETGNASRQLFRGNMLLVGCCAFYLLWWILSDKPTGAIKGFKSGWLLIPALVLGIASVVTIIRGANATQATQSFFPGWAVLLAGAICYIALLFVTQLAFHRQVTTELLLIVGWAALSFLEVNALYSLGIASHGLAIGLFAAAVSVAVASMVCYMLFYGLDAKAGYIDGMIPLILGAAYMLLLSVLIMRSGK